MKVSVIGLGYIGLPTATILASRGVDVVGVDISENIVKTVNEGKIHIIEPELDALVATAVQRHMLRATTTTEPADAFMIAVPTPFHSDRSPDLRYVEAAARSIAKVLAPGNIVILESTSPVGTTERLVEWLKSERPDLSFPYGGTKDSDINVAYCPERVLPGHVVRELVENDRVIGGITQACSERAKAIYATFVTGELICTSARAAEMCKLTENAYRDINIALANELSMVCDDLNIDVWELINLANRHPRVSILKPGSGVGGHCIAVDPWFIVSRSPEKTKLIKTAREVNDSKPAWVIDKILQERASWAKSSGKLQEQVTIGCYGLAFKPNIDDLRESPALWIAEQLKKRVEENLFLIEPHIKTLPSSLLGSELLDVDAALVRADIHIVLVGHEEFRRSESLANACNLDFTGIFAGDK